MNLFEQKIQEQMRQNESRKNLPLVRHNFGEFIGAVLSIHTPEEARDFFRGYYEFFLAGCAQRGEVLSISEQEGIIRSNIGWCFGEGMSEKDMTMWASVTGARHPVFGQGSPTLDEAFQAGLKLGKKP